MSTEGHAQDAEEQAAAAYYAEVRKCWPKGPWDNEPDRVEWKTAAGFPGLIVRSVTSGALCGYVGVPPGHPAHGADPGDLWLSVHGGITYAEHCSGHICHKPAPGEPDEVFWIGFDCGHGGDRKPALEGVVAHDCAQHGMAVLRDSRASATYRDLAYVRAEVEDLAKQLAEPPYGVTSSRERTR